MQYLVEGTKMIGWKEFWKIRKLRKLTLRINSRKEVIKYVKTKIKEDQKQFKRLFKKMSNESILRYGEYMKFL